MSASKVNRAKVLLFVLGATLGNLALMAVSFALFMLLYSALLEKILPPEALIWAIAVSFLLALVVSTLVYRRVLKLLRDRYRLDELLGLTKR